MNRQIYGILILLVTLLMMVGVVRMVSAQSSSFSIYAYDSYGNPAGDAYITVYQGIKEVMNDRTDYNGVCRAQLNLGTAYRITANRGGQYGDWNGIADNSQGYRISIYMK